MRLLGKPFHLRYWRQRIYISQSQDAPKALGIHWDVSKDTLHVATPSPDSKSQVTKRKIASDFAKVFDILGLFSPSTIQPKILLQRLWKLPLSWDSPVPDNILQAWQDWIKELSYITAHPVDRRYSASNSPIVFSSLHGFSDASRVAYGAAVYLRQVHEDTTVTVTLVFSKARHLRLATSQLPHSNHSHISALSWTSSGTSSHHERLTLVVCGRQG